MPPVLLLRNPSVHPSHVKTTPTLQFLLFLLNVCSTCLLFKTFGYPWAASMAPLFKCIHQLSVLLAVLNQLVSFTYATPTSHASQLSSLSNEISSRTHPLYSAALTSHPKRAPVTKGTFCHGLWSLALTTATFLAQGPSSSIAPASSVEFFAQKILDKVATRIATGAAERAAFGWSLDGVSITFVGWINPATQVASGVPWEVVQEFVKIFVLSRAQRGTVLAFSGYIWGPSHQCVKIVLEVAGGIGISGVASNILDSASEIHGSN